MLQPTLSWGYFISGGALANNIWSKMLCFITVLVWPMSSVLVSSKVLKAATSFNFLSMAEPFQLATRFRIGSNACSKASQSWKKSSIEVRLLGIIRSKIYVFYLKIFAMTGVNQTTLWSLLNKSLIITVLIFPPKIFHKIEKNPIIPNNATIYSWAKPLTVSLYFRIQ